MNRDYQNIIGVAIDAAAEAMRPGDSPLPLHVIEAVVGCTVQECSLYVGKIADEKFLEWRKGLKADQHLEGVADGLDDAAAELLKLCGVVKVIDCD